MNRRTTAFLGLVIVAACTPKHRQLDHVTVRDLPAPSAEMRLGVGDSERFGLQSSPDGTQNAATQNTGTQNTGNQPAGSAPFDFDLPGGWSRLPAAELKPIRLQVPGGSEAWVTVMGPGAGGPLGNLERWRRQFGLPAPLETDVAALPTTTLLGDDALLVDLVSADETRRMLGVMYFGAGRSVFVRMEGSPAAVAAAEGAFHEFVASLREAEPTAVTAAPYRWTLPAQWSERSPGQFQTALFDAGDGVRVWISVLGGDGGGISANIERWCTQVGVPRLSDRAIDNLPRLDVLGKPALLVELLADGDAVGLVSVLCERGVDTVFVKMQGPSAAMRGRLEAFKTFCTSLTVGG